MSDTVSSVATMIIDCDTCEVRNKACGECIVSFLNVPVRESVATYEPVREVVMDADQRAAVDALVAGGLVPPLRLVREAGPAEPLDRRRSGRPERSVARHAS